MSGVDAGQAARTVRSYLRWVTRAKPGDYVIALSAVSASTPVIGRHIQPISGMAALGVCGKTYLPGIVSSTRSSPHETIARQRTMRGTSSPTSCAAGSGS